MASCARCNATILRRTTRCCFFFRHCLDGRRAAYASKHDSIHGSKTIRAPRSWSSVLDSVKSTIDIVVGQNSIARRETGIYTRDMRASTCDQRFFLATKQDSKLDKSGVSVVVLGASKQKAHGACFSAYIAVVRVLGILCMRANAHARHACPVYVWVDDIPAYTDPYESTKPNLPPDSDHPPTQVFQKSIAH